jgi:glycosyltransferase
MKVSIITATYNSASTIRDTLDSVAEQTYSNIEHIIIDGLSKDNTLDIVREYPHVAKIISESDKGIYDAMNKGIQYCTGDIIAILNSDDFYASNRVVEDALNEMKTFGTDTLYGDLEYVEKNDTTKVIRKWQSNQYKKKNWLNGWMLPHPTFFVRKEVYEKYGVFDLTLKSAADYELMLRFLYRYNVSTTYLSYVLVKMRTGGQSNMSIANRYQANLEDRMAWKKNGLKPKFYTTYWKPIRKVIQYFT